MAINEKIIEKIRSKSEEDAFLSQALIESLALFEEGKQGKKIIDNIVKNLHKED
ncbi:MAG: hypothetical protein MJZ77_05615 [Bacteroidales bacterium]|nr:hypothetical protein [Bacteroidales bacterium]